MLNYREVSLLLSEIPFQNSYIQDVRESDFHSFTLSLFNKEEKAFDVYFEIATSTSHFSMTKKTRKKSRKMQRFTQLLRSRVVGSRVIEVRQLPFDRAFYLKLIKDEKTNYLLFRFYSGPGANVIYCDEDGIIIDLMFRRPKRGEISGEKLKIEERTSPPEKDYQVREHDENISFNEYIDRYYLEKERGETLESLKEEVLRQMEKECSEIEGNIRRFEEKIRNTKGFEDEKRIADLLSSNLHLVRKGDTQISVTDYMNNEIIHIPLRPELSARENLERYYKAYQKDKKSYETAIEDLKRWEERLSERKKYYQNLLESPDIRKIGESLKDNGKKETERRYHGPSFIDSGFTIIVGRSSKENDEILRHDAKGNDMWVHVRDYAGGYVIIKKDKSKDIPFSIILDAAHLAVHYSKAKDEKNVDLYYTYVKYLRRAKDAKRGLVLPTQEKNLALRIEDERMRRVLSLKVD